MRRNERAVPKTVQRAADPSEIRPKLRFLLSDEAREEGKTMVRYFRCYTLSRPSDNTRSQFSAIARHIREGRYPNIAAADALMGGVLVDSVEKIASGFRQPEWMLWRSSWANALADGWPSRMEGAAIRMMTRDERFLPSMIDDETALLPNTTVDGVYAGGGFDPRGQRGATSAALAAPYKEPSFTPEQIERKAAWDAAAELKRYSGIVIEEIERVTREKFSLAWKTKDELHSALRRHFKAAGYDEELDLRWLRLGGY